MDQLNKLERLRYSAPYLGKLKPSELSPYRFFSFSHLVLFTMITFTMLVAHHLTHFFFARFKTTADHHAHAKCAYTSHHSFVLSFREKRYINNIYSCISLERIFMLYVVNENLCEQQGRKLQSVSKKKIVAKKKKPVQLSSIEQAL